MADNRTLIIVMFVMSMVGLGVGMLAGSVHEQDKFAVERTAYEDQIRRLKNTQSESVECPSLSDTGFQLELTPPSSMVIEFGDDFKVKVK